MRADLIDVSIEDYGQNVLVTLRGHFTVEQVPALREKLGMLVEERKRTYLLDLQSSQFDDPAYLELFLDLLNAIAGREGRLALIFSNEANTRFFARWSKLFDIHASVQDFTRSGFLEGLRKRGVTFSKKTGVRISTGMALLVGLLIFGWILTLIAVIRYQELELSVRERTILEIEGRQRVLMTELKELHSAVGPLRELGMFESKTPGKKEAGLEQWVEYLERLEQKRTGVHSDTIKP